MYQEDVLVQDESIDGYPLIISHPDPERRVNKEEILRVLKRAADDDRFIAQLTHRGSETLEDYDLSAEAKAALLSGDIGWVEKHVGELDAHLSTWLWCRLEQEIW